MRSQTEIGDILREMGERIEAIRLNSHQLRTLSSLRRCRTAELGGHVDACTECGTVRVSYNACRNRCCPKCQGSKREAWIADRNSELLPVPYFHVVFTLPDTLNTFCLHHPREAYGLLFNAVWETLRLFGQNKHVTMGMISVLHTWGQNLSLHPHLHCIVPGGGIDKNGKWQNIRTDGKYLFPVKALSKVFRAKYVSLSRKTGLLSQDEIDPLFSKPWVVYAKRPFFHPSHVVEYLGRYTHKVAISNNRLLSYSAGKVRFSYRDYRHGACKKEMELDDTEFIRRFALHIPPLRFIRVRHFGILSSTSKKVTVPAIRLQFGVTEISYIDLRKIRPFDSKVCPCCGSLSMVTVETIPTKGPLSLPPPQNTLIDIRLLETSFQSVIA
jgi:hypothetical protein